MEEIDLGIDCVYGIMIGDTYYHNSCFSVESAKILVDIRIDEDRLMMTSNDSNLY